MSELLILGTRGVPARHGGFETLAERLALFLAQNNWNVSVYCQEEGSFAEKPREEMWQGVRRIIVPVPRLGPLSTMLFDFRCLIDAARRSGALLVLGYNTAGFLFLPQLRGRKKVINMDGLEWKRRKWSPPARGWLWLNERMATMTGALLIADNPVIEQRIQRIAPWADTIMIPYGADLVENAPSEILGEYGLNADDYFLVISRLEPENSVLEMVRAFSSKPRKRKLVVIGNFDPANNRYHKAVLASSSKSVVFLGAIYDDKTVKCLRFFAWAYCHGHQVGGTNPSLVEALGARNAAIVHDNPFNRWTAGEGQFFFKDEQSGAILFDTLDAESGAELREKAREAAIARFASGLTWPKVLDRYRLALGHGTSEARVNGTS